MSKPDGGPVFPNYENPMTVHLGKTEILPIGGMSLRDYFAAQAMGEQIRALAEVSGRWNPEACAALAYEFADAMLKARER